MLPIPEAGLSEVLRSWSGKAQLYASIAAVEHEFERRWNPSDVEGRAMRVLVQQVEPLLLEWPTRENSWTDALPGEIFHEIEETLYPTSNTDWRKTRVLGWPPTSFIGKSRYRIADSLLVTAISGTLRRLKLIVDRAKKVEPNVDVNVHRQLQTAFALLENPLLAAPDATFPSRTEIRALLREGAPWWSVARVAEVIERIDTAALEDFAREMLIPDQSLRWRLFHLGVMGEVLLHLASRGATLISLRPLSGGTPGPAYTIRLGDDNYDLWFEAAGAWSFYGHTQAYTAAVANVSGTGRVLGPDILLVHPENGRALLIECKYSDNPETFARLGYLQVLAYATEVHSRLAPDVTACVVVPTGVVTLPSFGSTNVGRVGIVPAGYVQTLVHDFLRGQC